MMFADLDAEFDRVLSFEPVRYPVLNFEPRREMSLAKWRLIWERDGSTCWACSRLIPVGAGEIDHVIPRSSFGVEDLAVADRSDNLRLACVACNQEKSNYTVPYVPRQVGVTVVCSICAGEADGAVPAYCGECGLVSRVPDEGWLL